MSFDRFVVTHLAPEMSRGYVRQISTEKDEMFSQPIQFDLATGAQIWYCEDGFGYSLPFTTRVPEIGTELMGSIARDGGPKGMVLDANGNPFLRNWGFADQHDAILAELGSSLEPSV